MPNFVSWGPYFPGDHETCHQVNEYFIFDKFELVTNIYYEAIANIVFNGESMK